MSGKSPFIFNFCKPHILTPPTYTHRYDTDDSWIDDSELVMQQEERDECAATITQHQGFFVNTGELQVTSNYGGRTLHVEKSAKKKDRPQLEKKSTEKKMDKSVTTTSQTQKPKK
jgi:hypothetical protein